MLRRHHKDEPPRKVDWPKSDRVKTAGTIVHSPDAPSGASGPTFLATAASHDYEIEVPFPDGSRFRTTVSTFSRIVHQVDAQIFVEIDSRTGTVSVDHHAMSLLATKLMKEHAAEIPGSQAQAQARREKPATFDPIPASGNPSGFAEPVVPTFSDPSSSFGLDVPPPSPYPQAEFAPPEFAPPASYGPAGAFDFGPGEGSKEQKLARLRQLLDKGILTESEYQAQVREVRASH